MTEGEQLFLHPQTTSKIMFCLKMLHLEIFEVQNGQFKNRYEETA